MAFGFGVNKSGSRSSSDQDASSRSQGTSVSDSFGRSQNTASGGSSASSNQSSFGVQGSKSGSQQRSVFGNQSASGVWGEQSPFLTQGYGGAQQLYGQGPYQYFGEGVNPLNEYQQQAIDNRFQRGLQGSAQEQALGDTLLRLLQGDQGPDVSGAAQTLAGYERAGGAGLEALQQTAAGGANPYLDRTFDAVADRAGKKFNEYVLPGVNTTFGGAGRAGSAAHERAVGTAGREFGETLGDLGAQIYGGAYETDANRRLAGAQNLASLGLGAGQTRGNLGIQQYGAQTQRQLGAGALVPELSGLEVQNLNLQQEAGDRLRAQEDLALQDRADKFYYNQDAENQALQRFIQSIGGAISTSRSAGGGSSAGSSFGSSFGRSGSQASSTSSSGYSSQGTSESGSHSESQNTAESTSRGRSRSKSSAGGFNIGF